MYLVDRWGDNAQSGQISPEPAVAARTRYTFKDPGAPVVHADFKSLVMIGAEWAPVAQPFARRSQVVARPVYDSHHGSTAWLASGFAFGFAVGFADSM